MEQQHQWTAGNGCGRCVLGTGFHHVEPNSVGMYVEVTPWTTDTDHGWIGVTSCLVEQHGGVGTGPTSDGYQPDGSTGLMALVFEGASSSRLKTLAVSLTLSMVACGPRMRLTCR
ncbi:Uncharacterised protein [Mycobacteroides abscessus subsp. massiliense]|nr:Uncharacterised protein [Mycobacteroides abscessus]CPZ18487.1 Uncharacterised protein [Mycobacteroides abscessus]SKT74898.1 Uncharacterised protein [Mycobacteroides abscessus subsp. abscessus]SKV17092.1 Uncharacterised protein [Mycobacteroides abscessus subsp. massiliense]